MINARCSSQQTKWQVDLQADWEKHLTKILGEKFPDL